MLNPVRAPIIFHSFAGITISPFSFTETELLVEGCHSLPAHRKPYKRLSPKVKSTQTSIGPQPAQSWSRNCGFCTKHSQILKLTLAGGGGGYFGFLNELSEENFHLKAHCGDLITVQSLKTFWFILFEPSPSKRREKLPGSRIRTKIDCKSGFLTKKPQWRMFQEPLREPFSKSLGVTGVSLLC